LPAPARPAGRALPRGGARRRVRGAARRVLLLLPGGRGAPRGRGQRRLLPAPDGGGGRGAGARRRVRRRPVGADELRHRRQDARRGARRPPRPPRGGAGRPGGRSLEVRIVPADPGPLPALKWTWEPETDILAGAFPVPHTTGFTGPVELTDDD